MLLAPGVRLGAYEVLSPIGSGGMGEVYRARDIKLKRDVALKVLPEQFALDADRLARFKREAQVLASLNHPNIAAIYGLEESSVGQSSVQALVLELVEGPTLADLIAARTSQAPAARASSESSSSAARASGGGAPRALEIDEALPIARQIAEALEAAHEHGIIHRDLKPANIKVRPDGTVKVLDFGLAKLTEGGAAGSTEQDPAYGLSQSPTITSPAATRLGVIMGTAAYMSPEQAKGKTLDKRTDVWSFGCVLYEMLAGKRAFEADDVSDTLASILKGDPDWSALPEDTPFTIARILRRCLEKDPRRRLHDVADARLDLDDRTVPEAAAPVSVGPSRKNRERLAWTLVAVFAVVCVAALALASLTYLNSAPSEERAVRAIVLPPENWSIGGPNPPSRLAVSPDGRRLAFVATGPGGATRLWVRPIDALSAQSLEGTEGAFAPFWSPDSSFLAFFAGGKLKKIDPGGGPAMTLCDAEGTSGAAAGGTWNQAGVIVFATSTAGGELRRVSASGGVPTAVTKLGPGQTRHYLPFFLPDGEHFVYRADGSGTAGQGSGEIFAGSLESNESKLLVRSAGNAMYARGHLLFPRETTLMAQAFDAERLETTGEPFPVAEDLVIGGAGNGAFAVSEAGVIAYQMGSNVVPSRLLWFNRAGKQIAMLGDQADYGGVELSPTVLKQPLAF